MRFAHLLEIFLIHVTAALGDFSLLQFSVLTSNAIFMLNTASLCLVYHSYERTK